MTFNDDEQRRRFEALVHASPDFIAVASIDGKVEFLNAAGRRLAGIPAEVDVTETSITDYLTPEGLRASLEVEQPAVVRDGFWTGETTLRDWRDDSSIPVAVTSFLVTDVRTGEPIALATIQRDLREVRAANEQAALARAALEVQEQRQRALLLHLSDLLLLVDAGGSLLYASPSAGRLFGVEEGSHAGRSVLSVLHPDDQGRVAKALGSTARRAGPSPPLLIRVPTPDGRTLDYEALANNLLDEPAVNGIVIVLRDVTDRLRAERAATAQAEVLELIAGEAPVHVVLDALALWVEDQLEDTACSILLTEPGVPQRVLRHVAAPNMPAAYKQAVDGLSVAAGWSPCSVAVSDAAPVLVSDLFADQRWEPMYALARQCEVRSCWSFPVTSPASGATLGAFALYRGRTGLPDPATVSLIDRASHLVGIAVDRHRLLQRLAHQAHHDALTLLPNRLRLLESLTAALKQAEGGGALAPVVVFLDLDRLKIINDSLGHEVGDELLVVVAKRLSAAVGEGDLVARFGGDEFVVLSTRLRTSDEVTELVEQVLASVSQPVALEGRQITPAASAGVVVAAAGETASEVLRDADIAMYRAKHSGGGGYALFGADMRQRAFDRLDLEDEIRHGLANDEFRVYYQPIVDMRKDDRILGFEGLVRWQHPQRGLLGPGEFIGLAEETGLIVLLGEWVMRRAVADARAWSEVVPTEGLTMSVNLSGQQLFAPGLLASVTECRQLAAPWTLGLELTESTLMDDTVALRNVIDDMAATGARLSIDDFGTGYSSLSYLTRLPVRRLKIDRSFISDLGVKPEAATVAAAIIGLAGELRLTVVAEGIETQEQRSTLLDMGCRYAQGYLFGRPVPGDAALALLQQQRASPAGS